MKTMLILTLIAAVFLPIFLLVGCGSKGGSFGQPISETRLTAIADILAHPQEFSNKTVKIEGKIMEECPAGGWFMLKDNSGIIYVNLHPSEFAIPQASGHKAVAQGVVTKEGTQVSVTGQGVEIK